MRKKKEIVGVLGILSPAEKAIFFMLADGKHNSEIAKSISRSPRTVETHRARLLKKLSLRDNVDLVKFALRNALIKL